jgi:hypothetical protein
VRSLQNVQSLGRLWSHASLRASALAPGASERLAKRILRLIVVLQLDGLVKWIQQHEFGVVILNSQALAKLFKVVLKLLKKVSGLGLMDLKNQCLRYFDIKGGHVQNILTRTDFNHKVAIAHRTAFLEMHGAIDIKNGGLERQSGFGFDKFLRLRNLGLIDGKAVLR